MPASRRYDYDLIRQLVREDRGLASRPVELAAMYRAKSGQEITPKQARRIVYKKFRCWFGTEPDVLQVGRPAVHDAEYVKRLAEAHPDATITRLVTLYNRAKATPISRSAVARILRRG